MEPTHGSSARQLCGVLALAGLLCLGLLTGSCQEPEASLEHQPLLQSGYRAEIVTEQSVFEPPPSLRTNRFVSGWWPWKDSGETLLVSIKDTVRLEGANLANSTRRLRLDGKVLDSPAGATVELFVGNQSFGKVPLVFPIEIDLPEDLPHGRFPIDLRLSAGSQIAVLAANLDGALPAGDVTLGADAITQAGYSLVDYSLSVSSEATFETTFEPPTDVQAEQRFEIWLEHVDSVPERIYSWPQPFPNRLFSSNRIRKPLGEGVVRIRFAALGQGPPGIWKSPTVGTPKRPAPTVTDLGLQPPKLVLVYVMDALRADHLGHLGGPAGITPTLDRLATEGTTLLDHYSVAPNTVPSIKALFLGRTLRRNGGWKVPISGGTTLAERFQRAGYRTALFSANAYLSDIYGTARGFDYVSDEVVIHDLDPTGYSDNGERVHQAMLEWLENVPEGQNVFLYVQTLHPHNPYAPPPALEQEFTAGIDSSISGTTRVLRDIKQGRLKPTPADRDRLRGLYAASVRYNDTLISDLLDTLERRYQAGEMLFVATSDHGDELFEHGGVLHGYTLYEEQIHIPAIFWWPGTIEPCRLQAPTDHIDLQFTLRTLIEETPPGRDSGRSLWPEMSQCRSLVDPSHLRFAAAASLGGGLFLARSGDLKYIWAPRWGQGEGAGRSRDGEYVFDLSTDPGEMENLAGSRSLRTDWLRSELQAWVERDSPQAEDQEEVEIDDKERARLRALGYLD
jgi:arylsulfatase A-like enzyme